MKKVFLTLAAAAAFTFSAKAQVSFIPKAGITLTNVAFPKEQEEEGQKSTTGLLFGAGFNLPLSEDGFFSLQPELLYIQKGIGYNQTETNGGIEANVKGKIRVNYFELPVLAKISFGGESVKGYVNAGPSLGYALSRKMKGTASVQGQSQDFDEKMDFDSEDDNRLDLGLQFGGGVSFQAGPGSIVLDLRYGYGLSNMAKTPEGEDKSDYKSQNRAIAISVGYAIPLGGK